MQYASPLIRARLARRYKRFLADVTLGDGAAATVHCPNPGAMLGLADPGMDVWLSSSSAKGRKLPLTWELTETSGGLVGINTLAPNRLVREALEAHAIPEFEPYEEVRREVKFGSASRIDFVLRSARRETFLEVKNVHLSRTAGLAEFPDCKAARSARHARELAAHARAGGSAAILFLVQRQDCTRFAPAGDLDPAFADALAEARRSGVQVLVYGAEISLTGLALGRPLALDF